MENKVNPNWYSDAEYRDHPWPGLNWLTTMLDFRDINIASIFYEEVFRLIPIFKLRNSENELIFIRMRYRGANITLNQKTSIMATCSHLSLYLYVDSTNDVDQIYTKAVSKGCKSLEKANLTFWGDYKIKIEDQFGYIWEIATKI